MKVVHISTRDSLAGAYRATYRLHHGLRKAGIDSQMLVARKYTQDPTVHLQTATIPSRLLHMVRQVREMIPAAAYPKRIDLLSPAVVSANLKSALRRMAPDVINLHWIVHGFVRPVDLTEWHRPIVWTMHDMWPFTGGCHHSGICERYRETCGACPVLASSDPHDLSNRVWRTKNKYWHTLNFAVVAPSRWLGGRASNSSLFHNKRIEVIPNGLDIDIYRPQPKQEVRAKLGLPQETKIILFGAVKSTSDPRKGYQLLIPALDRLAHDASVPNLQLVVVGSDQTAESSLPSIPTYFTGFINDEEKLAAYYAAADLFVAPSIEDNLPYTVMEAIACGTPAIAFNIGGMSDMIEHQQNGYLATPLDIDDLAHGMAWVLADDERYQKLSLRARAKAMEQFAQSRVTERYRTLYEELLQEFPRENRRRS